MQRTTRSARAVAVALAVMAAVLLLASCSSSGSGTSSSSSSGGQGSTTSSGGDALAFCDAFSTLAQGYTGQTLQEIDALAQQISDAAPSDVRDDAAHFAKNLKAIAQAADAAGGASSFDSEAFLASLDDEQKQFVRDLTAATTTGSIPGGYVGTVLTYASGHCSAPASTFSSVGSVIN